MLCLWEKAQRFTVQASIAPIAKACIVGLLGANIGDF
jgi:hypothetical protein